MATSNVQRLLERARALSNKERCETKGIAAQDIREEVERELANGPRMQVPYDNEAREELPPSRPARRAVARHAVSPSSPTYQVGVQGPAGRLAPPNLHEPCF